MSHNIIRPRDFQTENLTFAMSRMKQLENGQKIVPVSYNGRPLVFQTAEMAIPFGLSKYVPKDKDGSFIKGADPKVTLELSFRNMDTKPNIKLFYDALSQFDTLAKQAAFDNSFTLFRKKLSEENVALMYSHAVRVATDKQTGEPTDKFPPTFRMNIPFREGRYNITVYNKDREDVTENLEEYLVKGARCSALVQCTGLWIAGKGFGSSWKVVQLVATPPERISGYSFLPDPMDLEGEDEENLAEEGGNKSEEGEETTTAAAAATSAPPPATSNQVADSDEEEDDDEPTPVLTTKKVTTARRATSKK